MAATFAASRGALSSVFSFSREASQIETDLAASRALGQGPALLGSSAFVATREPASQGLDVRRHIQHKRKRRLACRAAGASSAEKAVARSEGMNRPIDDH